MNAEELVLYDEIVIDTNVLVHAGNGQEVRCESSRVLIELLISSQSRVCVDTEVELAEPVNSSFICKEYVTHLPNGSLGHAVLSHLAGQGRIVAYPKRCAKQGIPNKIDQLIKGTKPRDRIFLNVAASTSSKVLVSHDFEDFAAKKRKTIKKEIGVSVVCANNCYTVTKAD